jgi:predicted exporter
MLAWLFATDRPWDTRITSLLPDSQKIAPVERAETQLTGAFEDRLSILVGDDTQGDKASFLLEQLRAQGIIDPLDANQFLPPGVVFVGERYHLLAQELADATPQQWADRALHRLYSPGLDNDLRRDPFGLLDAWIKEQTGNLHLEGQFPVFQNEEQHWLLVSGNLSASPYDMDLQRRLGEVMADFRRLYPDTPVLRAGLIFHAAAGANQARAEISTIGLGSLLGIMLLLWMVFRDCRTLLSLLMPVGCGLLFALPLTWLIFGTLNVLTLAFGASLIGIAIDYALHLQCSRHLDPTHCLSRLWPALLLGLLSSLAAYLVQLATPLPGLRQMATFAILGLIGSWITVRFWLPRMAVRRHPATEQLAQQLNRLRLPANVRYPWYVLGLLGLICTGLILIGLKGSNDLRQLNTSPPELIAEMQQFQALAGGPSGRSYLLVMAADQQSLLTRLETLDPILRKLAAEDDLGYYRHIAQPVPSADTQQRNLQRIRQGYAGALPILASQANLPDTVASQITAALDQARPLSIDVWLASLPGQRDRALWLAPGESADFAAIIVLGDMNPKALQRIQQLAKQDDLRFEDSVQRLGQQFATLRNTIALWLIAAVFGLVLLFVWRYGKAAWRVLLPPVGAIVITLALFSALSVGLTLFHLLGLLLVLGIGLDAGIFSVEHANSRAAWLAVSLSCSSSLLAFGLLALSATPALAQLGSTCLVGLACTWLLVPFARAGGLVSDSSSC